MALLPAALANGVREAAERLRSAGHRSWLVGGAVRDLALEIAPQDGDLATTATPEEIERLFVSTHAVGKAFGTVVVRLGEIDLQVTTLRSESSYADARRPADVRFGTSLEEDAARRDFTCNALYLVPETDELVDPTGGWDDLAQRRLRCVGDAQRRFTEDGLRLLRLARLAAHYALEVERGTLAGAAASLAALRGVSAERVLAELVRVAEGPDPGRALAILLELGVLARLPGLGELGQADLQPRCAAVARLGPAPGAGAFFAALLRPASSELARTALDALRALRPKRALLEACARAWALEPELVLCQQGIASGALRPSRWIRLVRDEAFDLALVCWRAWHPLEGEQECTELLRRARALGAAERRPELFITSGELARAGVPRGPRWSELLREAEDLQLDGELTSPAQARAWLAERARER